MKRLKKPSSNLSKYDTKVRIGLGCKTCGEWVEGLTADTKEVICSHCVQRSVAPPEEKKAPEEKRPRGWQFMNRYVSPSGKVYCKGREVHEPVKRDSRGVERNAKPKRAKKAAKASRKSHTPAKSRRGAKRR